LQHGAALCAILAAVANGRAHLRRGRSLPPATAWPGNPQFCLDLQANFPANAPPHCSCAHWRLALPAMAH
jgi:hypothetical protein